MADDWPELRRRHACRDAGGARRGRLQRRRLRHLVSVEEPVHHAVLLADGASLPADPAHDDGGVHRGPLRPLDGRHLHRLCAVLLHHQHGQHAEGGRQGHQPGDRRHGRRQRDRGRDDRDVHPLQLRRRSRRRGLDGSVPGLPDHRAVVHADPARVVGGRRHGRPAGIPRAVPLLAGHAVGHHAVGDRDADGQRPRRDHGAAASARHRRDRARRADLPHRHGLRQHGEAGVHGWLGARRPDRRGDDRAGARPGA